MYKPVKLLKTSLAVLISVLIFVSPSLNGIYAAGAGSAPVNGPRISAGDNHHMVVLDDGTLWGWGYDNGVHLGLRYNGSEVISRPTKIMDNVKSAVAAWGTNLVIKNDNTLWAWGDNIPGAGEERLAYALAPEKIMDNVASATAGNWFVMAVKTDGTLWGWGNNHELKMNEDLAVRDQKNKAIYVAVTKPMKLMDNVKKVEADTNTACILKNDGTLLSTSFTLGEGKSVKIGNVKYKIVATNVKDMSMTCDNIYFIKNDDTLWGVGKKTYEDLAYEEGSYTYYKPVKIMDKVAAVSAHYTYPPLALKKDGKLVTWTTENLIDLYFYNKTSKMSTQKEIDDYFKSFKTRKSLTLMDNVREISAGPYHYLVTKNDGTVWAWGLLCIGDGREKEGTFGSDKFVKLEFSKDAGQLFTAGGQKSKLLKDWLKEAEIAGNIPVYDAGFKANWAGQWEADFMALGVLRMEQKGNIVYGYDWENELSLYGTIDGNKLKGVFWNGVFELTMLPDGKSFKGLCFANSAAEADSWSGTKRSGQ